MGLWSSRLRVLLAAALCAVSAGCASLPPGHHSDARDPWERYNRAVFAFNEDVDRAVLKPVAEAYRDYFPDVFKFLLGNFFGNLRDLTTAVHELLQGKPAEAGNAASRVLFNSTIGFFGLGDPASEMGFYKSAEDFGQTLAVWGAEPGPYLMLPLLGPSTVRDTLGTVVDVQLDPVAQIMADSADRSLSRVWAVIHRRAELLEAEGTFEALSFDRYIGLRDAYLARRRSQVYDGDPPPEPEKDD